MFELESAIAEWRRGLEQGPLSADAIDELESHLRDEFDRQRRAGDSEPAFAAAVTRLGEVTALHREFALADDGVLARIRRFFTRVNAGFAHSTYLNVLTIVVALLGAFGLYFFVNVFRVTYARWFAQPLPSDNLLPVRISMGLYAACGVVCALGIITSWRYWRSHEMASARGLVSFSLFFAWGYVDSIVLVYLSKVVLHPNPLFRYGSIERLWFWGGTLIVFVALWSICLPRLARTASTMPRIRRVQS